MNDFKLDQTTHDLVFEDGDLILLNNEALVATQTLEINLLTLKGEWFLDNTKGVPYLQTIFKKGTTKRHADTLFQVAIKESYNIVGITEFESSLGVDQVYTITNLKATTTDGDIVSLSNISI